MFTLKSKRGFELFYEYYYGVTEGGLGLGVLRTFRLLRIIKMVRFLPNLQRSLIVMLRTMDNVAVFFGLLMLFIFIFRFLNRGRERGHSQLITMFPFRLWSVSWA